MRKKKKKEEEEIAFLNFKNTGENHEHPKSKQIQKRETK
jgi:hypothetical protein